MKSTLNRNAGVSLAAALFTVVLTSGAAWAQGSLHRQEFLQANQLSLNQVPAVLAPSFGRFTAQVNYDETISYSLSYSNMSSAVTQAHIHFGAGKTNGGVIVFLCGGTNGNPVCPTSGTVTGTITPADVSTLPSSNGDSVIPQGIQPGDFAALLRAIRTGNAYVNVHTVNFPNGELRGRIIDSK